MLPFSVVQFELSWTAVAHLIFLQSDEFSFVCHAAKGNFVTTHMYHWIWEYVNDFRKNILDKLIGRLQCNV